MSRFFTLVTALLLVSCRGMPTFAGEIEVNGKVTCDGKPLKGVVIKHEAPRGQEDQEGVTDEDGGYAIKGIPCPEGTEIVTVQIDLLHTKQALVEGKSGEREKTVKIEPDRTEYQADFVLRTGKTVTGALLTADGKPVGGAMVEMLSGLVSITTTTKDGTFSVDGASSRGKSCLGIIVPQPVFTLAREVSFEDEVPDKKDMGEIRLPDLAALGTAQVTGTVRPSVPEGATLLFSVWNVDHLWGFSIRVGAGDKFDKRGVIPGKYLLVSPGLWFDKVELVRTGQECGVPLPNSLTVDIKEGENHLEVHWRDVKKAWDEYGRAVREAAAKRKDATK